MEVLADKPREGETEEYTVYAPYVRQDIFTSELKSLSIQMSSMEKLLITKIDNVEKSLNRRIDDMHQSQSKLITLFGVMLTVLSIMLAAIQIWK